MKKTILFLILFIVLWAPALWAAFWQVNNKPGESTDFTSIQAAIDDSRVTTGDTLLISGSTEPYDVFTLHTRLNIYGPGYFLSENPKTQAYRIPATVTGAGDTIVIGAGSEGSVLSGLSFGAGSGVDVNAYTSNIKIERCRFSCHLAIATSNIIISQNWLYDMTIYSLSNNNIITNNIINGEIIVVSTAGMNTFFNNISAYHFTSSINNSNFYNNIWEKGILMGDNNIYFNNIGSGDQFGTDNGNQANVVMSTVFLYSGSTDGKYMLKEGSPAIGAGYWGEDCGVYGGNTPYVLSGMPPIPSIYYFISNTSGTNDSGIQVQFKVKSHE